MTSNPPPQHPRGQRQLLRVLSGGVIDQALLSLGSFAVGLLLIRHASDADYGHYVLVNVALLLLVSLQGAYVGGPVAVLAPKRDPDARAQLISSVQRGSSRALLVLGALSAAVLAIGWLAGVDRYLLLLGLTAAIASLGNLWREQLRSLMQTYLRPGGLLMGDAIYVAVLLAGTAAAAFGTRTPVLWALLAMAVAAGLGGWPLWRSLARVPGWRPSEPGVWRIIQPLGTWSAIGALIYWLFGQGYNYLLAARLDVTAVAAVAATRLLMMPLNLLATGLRGQLVPMTAHWHAAGGMRAVLRRLLPLIAAITALALLYCLMLWLLREPVAVHVLRKQFTDYDHLLQLWMVVVSIFTVRTLLQCALLVREQFRFMAGLALMGALISAAVMLPGLDAYGARGALLGLLAGESFYLVAVIATLVVVTRRETATRR